MDIPTFVYDVYDLEGTERHTSLRSCPYLSRDNGAAWRTLEDLNTLLDEYYSGDLTFSPRQWCENNISDITVGKTILKAALSPEDFQKWESGQWENGAQKEETGTI
ncbi:MAG: hypothetical protein K2X66_02950 [Cyanobacteria bacterium]|nr:hypothetical protein [Cyanobacteriota bacterium]